MNCNVHFSTVYTACTVLGSEAGRDPVSAVRACALRRGDGSLSNRQSRLWQIPPEERATWFRARVPSREEVTSELTLQGWEVAVEGHSKAEGSVHRKVLPEKSQRHLLPEQCLLATTHRAHWLSEGREKTNTS